MKKWTKEEDQLLMEYAFSSDDETVWLQVEHARHMMYFEGNHPELKERTITACLTRFYKLSATNKANKTK